MSIPSKAPVLSPARAKRFSSLHRIIGITVLLPVLLLVATGVPLQFTEQLQLGRSGVDVEWLHSSYGIVAPEIALASGTVVQIGELLVVDRREIDTNFVQAGALLGSVTHDLGTTVALQKTILLVPQDTSIQIEISEPPHLISRFGSTMSSEIVIDTDQGAFVSRDLGTSWERMSGLDVVWLSARQISTSVAHRARYRASKLSWERVLIDMHSGRLFGPVGEWIMTFASLALVVLALTGLTLWVSARPKR